MKQALVIAALAALLPAGAALADKSEAGEVKLPSTSETFPVVGKATTVASPHTADTITVTYSPSSEVVETETLEVKKLTPEKPGKLYNTVWMPKRAGVVELSGGGATNRVSIRFDGVPMSGVAIMLVAAMILFGGAFWSLRSILRDDDNG